MSISPVGGAGAVPVHLPVTSVAKPEGREAPGAPDRDSDSDNGVTQGPAATRGTVNVKA